MCIYVCVRIYLYIYISLRDANNNKIHILPKMFKIPIGMCSDISGNRCSEINDTEYEYIGKSEIEKNKYIGVMKRKK